MNNVILMGRLTRDPELRFLQSGTGGAVARFTVAVDRQLSREKRQEMESKNQPTADFINVVAWGKLGENCARFTEKGKRVLVTGRIQTGSYDDKNGNKVYTTEVVASNVEFLDWKDNQSSSYNQPSYNGQQYGQQMNQSNNQAMASQPMNSQPANNQPMNNQSQPSYNNQQAQQGQDFASDGEFEFGADFDPTNDDGRIPF